jgi:hypothetical protein
MTGDGSHGHPAPGDTTVATAGRNAPTTVVMTVATDLPTAPASTTSAAPEIGAATISQRKSGHPVEMDDSGRSGVRGRKIAVGVTVGMIGRGRSAVPIATTDQGKSGHPVETIEAGRSGVHGKMGAPGKNVAPAKTDDSGRSGARGRKIAVGVTVGMIGRGRSAVHGGTSVGNRNAPPRSPVNR